MPILSLMRFPAIDQTRVETRGSSYTLTQGESGSVIGRTRQASIPLAIRSAGGSALHVAVYHAVRQAVWRTALRRDFAHIPASHPVGRLLRRLDTEDAVSTDEVIAAFLPLLNTTLSLIADVNSTGGIVSADGIGTVAPQAAPDWSDLAATYRNACHAVGLTPTVP